jgi:hypothetical protein
MANSLAFQGLPVVPLPVWLVPAWAFLAWYSKQATKILKIKRISTEFCV